MAAATRGSARPILADNIWLYGGSQKDIMESIAKGRGNEMPAWGEFLGEAKSHLLASYIYGQSRLNCGRSADRDAIQGRSGRR